MYGVKLRSFILVFSDKTNSHSLGPQKLIYSNLTEFCKINKKNYTNISKFTVIDSDSPQVALAPPPISLCISLSLIIVEHVSL